MVKHKSIRRLTIGFLAPLVIAAIAAAIPYLLDMPSLAPAVPIAGMAAGLIYGGLLVTSYAFRFWLVGNVVISAYFLFVGLGVWFTGLAVRHLL